MTLPNAAQAFVEEKKIIAYLLSDTHPQGRSKSRFFRAFGFVPERWQELALALCTQAKQGTLVETVTLPENVQYVMDGTLAAPDGRSPRVRTVWETKSTDLRPRLVTAYPAH